MIEFGAVKRRTCSNMSVRVERTVVMVAMDEDEDLNDSFEKDEVVVVDQAKDAVSGDAAAAVADDVMGRRRTLKGL